MKELLGKLVRTETLFTALLLTTSTAALWYGKIDGTVWLGGVTLIASIYNLGRSYVKAKGGE